MPQVPTVPTVEASTAPSPMAPGQGGLSRRSVLAAAGWSVPAIVAATSTPAFAASADRVVALTSPQMRVKAAGWSPITATVTRPGGTPFAGAAVSFSGPSGSAFVPSAGSTGSDGTVSTDVDLATPWAVAGSMATVSAVSDGVVNSQSFTVTGSNLVGAGYFYTTSESDPQQTPLVFPAPVVQAVSGLSTATNSDFVLALLSDGTVWGMGDNAVGELGDGTGGFRMDWKIGPALTRVIQIAAGDGFALALRSDGTVAAWGHNPHGQLGDGTTTTRMTPVDVSGLSGVSQIAALGTSAYALRSTGEVVAWGDNSYGQLGDGSTVSRSVPGTVLGLSGPATHIAATTISAAVILSDGSVQSWGSNGYGELGIDSTTMQTLPVAIDGLGGVKDLAGGFASFHAVLTDGTMRGWGMNAYGQLGDGTTDDRFRPVSVQDITNADRVTTGRGSTYALLGDGTARSWGANGARMLGNGGTDDSAVPVTVIIPAGRRVTGLGAPSAGFSAFWVTSAA